MMCGVVCGSNVSQPEAVVRLFEQSRIRGLHAFGYAYVKDGRLLLRRFLDYSEFVRSFKHEAPSKFIAHLRYSTSGDWQVESNNQPIIRNGIAIAFNGVLDMRTKSEIEAAYQIQMNTDNDAEIALHIANQSGLSATADHELIDFINDKQRTFAGAFLTETNRLFILRNARRPLAVGHLDGQTFVASTADILRRSELPYKTTPTNVFVEL